MDRDGFYFRRSYWEVLSRLRGNEKVLFVPKLLDYAFYGTIPEKLTRRQEICFRLIKDNIDMERDIPKETVNVAEIFATQVAEKIADKIERNTNVGDITAFPFK